MAHKEFEMRTKERDSFEATGQLEEQVKIKMALAGMDLDRPYKVVDDDQRRRVIFTQETTGDEDTEDQI